LPGLQFDAARPGSAAGQGALHTNELGPLRLAVLLQPVGVNQANGVLVGFLDDRTQEVSVGRGRGHGPSVAGMTVFIRTFYQATRWHDRPAGRLESTPPERGRPVRLLRARPAGGTRAPGVSTHHDSVVSASGAR